MLNDLRGKELKERKKLEKSVNNLATVADVCAKLDTNDVLLLADEVLFIYDSEEAEVIEKLANLTGATIVDEIIPYLTTRIICTKQTPHLRSIINSLHSRAVEGAVSNKAALTTDAISVEITTPEWLSACLVKQIVVDAGEYKPPIVSTTKNSEE